MAEKKDLEAGDPELECVRKPMPLPVLPKPLTLEEKKYLLAVERGDMANVRRLLQKGHRKKHIDINCVDSLGRGALTLSIDGENLEMVELLVIMGVETRDALLQAINAEFVEAVELLLEHEELIHKDGEPYSWQKVDPNTAMFTPDITPLMLAAHKNNYEIIKILLDRGATLPNPHDVRCGCEDCIRQSTEDSLRHSLARLNEYRALASPSLIALSSTDPILTAFELSWELRNLAFAEQESKAEYLELRRQAQLFAVDLLDQSRSSQELAIILNHDPDEPAFVDGEHMKLARLELAIDFKQKKFVAHPNIQQLLASIWYEGVPGFRRKTTMEKIMIICRVALLFPFYCTLYMIAPNCATGKLMRKPFMKFLIHASSYLFFLLILILVSQRAEVQAIQLFGPEWMVKELEKELLKQRGNGPTYLELVVVVYVLGFIWEETQEIYIEGIRSYLRNMWNFIDFTRNSLYVAVALLRFAAYLQQAAEIRRDQQTKFIPRESWDAFDPQLIAEGLFAAANIFSALKLVHLFSINPHLGPLQISLGRMVIDIVKFFFIYSLVLFAFACGLNQLLWYFADLEKKKCYVLPGGLPDWDNAGDSCMKWRSFGKNVIGAPIATTRLSEQALVCIPPRAPKFTIHEWKVSNDLRCRNAEDQQQLADRILGECKRVREETGERSEIMKATSDRRIEERIGDIEFNKSELQIQRKEICIELEALGVYKTRLQDCLASLQANALNICRKCLMLRDGRIGIDLVVDEVEQCLQQEITTIVGGQSLLKRVLEQLNEQMRRLRATRYLLDRDLQYKQAAIDIDKGSLSLKPTDLCLSVYEGYTNLDPANISADEYNAYSAKNIQMAAREVTSARPIRMFVDTILKQVIDDLWTAYNKCNHAFHERIEDTKRTKSKLEDMHRDTTQKIVEMQNNILQLQKALSDKEGNTALAHTRLGKRAQRVGAELVRDPPGQALYYECEMLRHSAEQLQQMLQEATASLRYLLQTQIQLEEDINVKMNTLKIDDVDCMTLRATMDYHAY
ncbi:transient-receptor-potential-like protein [Bombyx mandarina]|uniref:Transient-receptor-potential-like protein n=1 Tax=Bombyx mandarina TaxID=7092 RepID=A0A6J2J8A1_BOMMA|nr:transient-receptor-potential-like protein [Bombyx mandarina]